MAIMGMRRLGVIRMGPGSIMMGSVTGTGRSHLVNKVAGGAGLDNIRAM
jgi:hypothetical protein